MDHIGAHLQRDIKRRDRASERGDLMEFFAAHLNPSRIRDGYPPLSLARMGRLLQGIPTKDLYYLKSVCEHAKDFSKKFWWEIDPKKHTNDNKDRQKPAGKQHG